MQTLEFLGFHQDGRHLTLTDARGNRYLLEISDDLLTTLNSLPVNQSKDRALTFDASISNVPIGSANSVSTLNKTTLDNPSENIDDSKIAEISVLDEDSDDLEFVPTTLPPLRPREVQELLRSGVDAVDIAQRHGMNLERIRVYETPIVAERDYICSQAQKIILGADGGPELQDVVVDRLAAFDIAPEDITWDAIRPVDGNWQLKLSFPFQGVAQQASWQVDIDHGLLQPLSASAKWFSETQMTAHPGDLLDLMEGKNTRFDARRRSNDDSNSPLPTALFPEDAVFPPAPTFITTPDPEASAENVDSANTSTPPTALASSGLSPYSQADLTDNFSASNTIDFLDRLDAHRGTRQPVLIPTESGLSDEADPDYLDIAAFTDPLEASDSAQNSQTLPSLGDKHSGSLSHTDDVTSADIELNPAEAERSAEGTGEETDIHNFTNVVKLPGHEQISRKPGWDSLVNVEPTSTTEEIKEATPSREDSATASAPSNLDPNSQLDPHSTEPATTRKRKPSTKKQRRSVPSWEEIVFGTKPESE